VLQNESSDFRLEYPCRSETEERWFQVRVNPFRAAGRARAIISHENITDRKVNAASLKAKTRHLLAAGEVQKLLLPSQPTVITGYKFAGALLPADETAGDYYDFIPINAHRIAVAVADVSGHGIEAALVMAQLRGLLWALSTNSADPSQVLAQINPLLAHKSEQFVTMFLGYLDTLIHSLVYAAAGHNGFIVRANGDVEEMCSTTMPLGVLDNLHTDTITIRIEPGDVFIVLTDGLEEATGTTAKQFGIQRARDIVRVSRGKPVNDIVGELRQELLHHLGGHRQDDDVTIVVVKRDNI
jgi:serine phosphatase RsbU (regulator of sigma subunit)